MAQTPDSTLTNIPPYEMQEKEKAALTKFLADVKQNAKSSCPDCYGEGYCGFNQTHNHYVVCRCVRKNIQKKEHDEKHNQNKS